MAISMRHSILVKIDKLKKYLEIDHNKHPNLNGDAYEEITDEALDNIDELIEQCINHWEY